MVAIDLTEKKPKRQQFFVKEFMLRADGFEISADYTRIHVEFNGKLLMVLVPLYNETT